MVVIAEFTIDSRDFLLGQVLELETGAHVEVEKLVPIGQRTMPYVWVSNCDFDMFEETVRSSEHIDKLVALDRISDRVLYRVVWGTQVESLMRGFAESNASIMRAKGNDVWQFQIRFDSHSDLSEFHNYCTEHDIPYHVDRIYTLTEEDTSGNSFGLTDEQREALVRAVEAGYFSVPGEASLAELAAGFDISQQAMSERVRRAADKVLTSVLLDPSAADLH